MALARIAKAPKYVNLLNDNKVLGVEGRTPSYGSG